ncbi:Parkinson disease 7 domain-containing protein 1-like [Mizuhopecten yessoensis]|uniref:Glutamine amidotransferase-like class 1 domain-containing protein 1 n=1 Tax=Mizuhopecten yessoensis TaxID=6573 RepID=A0A210QPI8_MIZYE|nr:Parkinson disease 7 domain-containing protein 1-like [Mizuhopecten yessoensis]OWF50653.1 Parkinson disease 7 domain-containing protein 1 [Mizuhopecten yessoensis]
MAAPRPNCLLVLSAGNEGVSAQSFIQAYNLASSNFNIQLASPGGRNVEYTQQDESNRRWFNEFRSKASSTPIALDTVDAARYSALLLPSAPGALQDLATDKHLGQILSHFVNEKKGICAVGLGVAGLCAARKGDGRTWCFDSYSLTGPSVFELARSADFPSLSIIIEDFIKDNGGNYNSSEPDAVHIIIDRHLITGQNVQSTLTAVQNLTLMCAPKHAKVMSPR